jgi:hypothetical protein
MDAVDPYKIESRRRTDMKTTVTMAAVLALSLPLTAAAQSSDLSETGMEAIASGLGINLPLVARLIGAGATLYTSSVDVANNSTLSVQVDFYLDGVDLASSAPISHAGSISSSGALVAQGAGGLMRAKSNVHFDDFVDSLVQAGLLPANIETDGFIGSVLFVFNGFTKSGQGEAKVRFFSALAGGTIGQALKGHEITGAEPQSLVTSLRDSRGKPGPQLYANLFVNNTGLTPAGAPATGAVGIKIQAYANSSGLAVGTPINTSIGIGQTVGVNDVLHALAVPSTEDTILVFVTVTSGNAAIAGIQAQVDQTTRDGSVMDMNRADF